MVKVPPLGLLTTVLCAVLVSATLARPLPPPQLPLRRPAARHPGPASHEAFLPHAAAAHLHHAAAARGGTPPPPPSPHASPSAAAAAALGVDDFEDDGSARSERSTNLSALYGPGLPRRMFINDRHLQILPDGTVNGTHDQSDHTILHRLSVNKTQVKIQGLATCLFLCMDSCGLLYGSSEATEECVFTEKIDKETSYNTYSSVRYSNAKRTLYVALNKNGRPRKLQLRAGASFGKLMRQAKVLPLKVEEWHVKQLLARRFGDSLFFDERMVRHPSTHLCPRVAGGGSAGPRREQDEAGRDTARCRGRKKRGKKKRRCRKGEPESELCQRRPGAARDPDATATAAATTPSAGPGPRRPKKCLEGEATAACKKRLRLERRRRKARLGGDDGAATDAPAQRKKPNAKRPKPNKGKNAGKGAAGEGGAGSAKRKGEKEGKDKQQQNQRGLARRVTSDVKQGKNGGESVTMTSASSGATRARELTTRAASPSPPTTTAGTTTTAATVTPSTPTSVATPSSAAAAAATTKVERSVPTLAASLGDATPSRPPPAAPTETTEPSAAPEPAPALSHGAETAGAKLAAEAAAAARSPSAPEGASLVAEPAAAAEPIPVAADRLGAGWEASGSAPPAGADY
ncbi:hypothetical protein R5R35_011834 [Gryllus longicercus]|uniref:FGF n=1 Tax=Gryllus longicercus TaxID=2509291 RepID=A0AAN9ZHM9_9ORTH